MVQQQWKKPTFILCSFGLFISVRPADPFIIPFLMGPHHNLTEYEVVNLVSPVAIYSYLALLLPTFLLTDYVRYKPTIILQALGYIASWLLLLFTKGVAMMQLVSFSWAIALAGEIGYYSYVYSVVEEEYYQRTTSYTRGVVLVGTFLGSLLSQLLVSFTNLDYFYLNVISLVSNSIAFVIAFALPMPQRSLFFQSGQVGSGDSPVEDSLLTQPPEQAGKDDGHVMAKVGSGDSPEEDSLLTQASPEQAVTGKDDGHVMKRVESEWGKVLKQLWLDTRAAYTDPGLLRWSVWWALSMCGWLLVITYVQNLWEVLRPSQDMQIYNGAVESVAMILGAGGALIVGVINVEWSKWGELLLAGMACCKAVTLLVMWLTRDIWLCYVMYAVFMCLYSFVITITQFQLAVGLSTERSYALVFGVNTFMAVALNSLLTIVLIDDVGLGLDVRTQFLIYSGYFGIVSVIFLAHGVYALVTMRRNNERTTSPNRKPSVTSLSSHDVIALGVRPRRLSCGDHVKQSCSQSVDSVAAVDC